MEQGTTVINTPVAATGWFDTLKEHVYKLLVKIDLSWERLIEYVAALGFGALAGFLCKRYGRQVIVVAFVLSVILLGLHYADIISFDWLKIKEILGIDPTQTFDGIAQEYIAIIKENMITAIIAVIGFIVGYKIG